MFLVNLLSVLFIKVRNNNQELLGLHKPANKNKLPIIPSLWQLVRLVVKSRNNPLKKNEDRL